MLIETSTLNIRRIHLLRVSTQIPVNVRIVMVFVKNTDIRPTSLVAMLTNAR